MSQVMQAVMLLDCPQVIHTCLLLMHAATGLALQFSNRRNMSKGAHLLVVMQVGQQSQGPILLHAHALSGQADRVLQRAGHQVA